MKTRLLTLWIKCLLLSVGAQAQYGSSDLGPRTVSSLTWKQFSTAGTTQNAASIGLTTNGKVYVWGHNQFAEIHTNRLPESMAFGLFYTVQTTPYYRSMPNGRPVTKVANASAYGSIAFAALSQDSTLYGWGVNPDGLFGNAWIISTAVISDSTRTRRIPTAITIPGETKVLDFDLFASSVTSIIMIGGSGKAYVRGYYAQGTYTTTALQIPFPAGVTRYKRVWTNRNTTGQLTAYLLGNDDKLYATGQFSGRSSAGTLELNDPDQLQGAAFNLSTDIPKLVPLPAGVAVKEVAAGDQTSFILSTTGQAFAAGIWYSNRFPYSVVNAPLKGTYTFPLKNVPTISNTKSTTTTYVSDVYRRINSQDTILHTNKFLEVALPPGAQSFKYIDVQDPGQGYPSVNFIDNNNKVFWRGLVSTINFQNFLQYVKYTSLSCETIVNYPTQNPYAFVEEAVNLEGAVYSFYSSGRGFVISASGRGYVYGAGGPAAGLGRISGNGTNHPTLISNEQLDLCNPFPGSGGGTSGPAVGTIDCSKTQIVTAPVAGTPNQHALVVTVNVTTAGSFSPLSVSGSGMSLANGVTSVTATATGVQQFQIPIKYDGSALANNFQFTIGSAGSCTADLTLQSNPVLKNVYTLQNCTAITPGTLSK